MLGEGKLKLISPCTAKPPVLCARYFNTQISIYQRRNYENFDFLGIFKKKQILIFWGFSRGKNIWRISKKNNTFYLRIFRKNWPFWNLDSILKKDRKNNRFQFTMQSTLIGFQFTKLSIAHVAQWYQFTILQHSRFHKFTRAQ